MPSLERLTLEDMDYLSAMLLLICEAGHDLDDAGLAPVFDLSPGQSPMIHLTAFTMPHAWTADEGRAPSAEHDAEFAAAIEEFRADAPAMQNELCAAAKAIDDSFMPRDDAPYVWTPDTGVLPIGGAKAETFYSTPVQIMNMVGSAGRELHSGCPDTWDAPDHPDHTEHPDHMGQPALPAAPPPAVGDTAPDQPEQTSAMTAGAEPGDEGGGAGVAAPVPAATSNPDPNPNTGPNSGPNTGPAWTDEETAQLVQLVVQGVMDGNSKAAATRAAADVLGRPHEGTAFRLRIKAKDAFEAALQAATKVAFEAAEKTEILGGEPGDSLGGLQREYLAEKAPASPAAPPEAQPLAAAGDGQADLTHQQRLVVAHLRALGCKPPFDRFTDLALVQALGRGEKVHEFATDFGLDSKAVIDRFAALSASQRDRDNRLPIGAMTVLSQALHWLIAQA